MMRIVPACGAMLLVVGLVCEGAPVPKNSIRRISDTVDAMEDYVDEDDSVAQPCRDRNAVGGNGAAGIATNLEIGEAIGGFGGPAMNNIACGAKGGDGGNVTGAFIRPGSGGPGQVFPSVNPIPTSTGPVSPECGGRQAEGGNGGNADATQAKDGFANDFGGAGGAGIGTTGCGATGGNGGKASGKIAVGGNGGYAQVMTNPDLSVPQCDPPEEPPLLPVVLNKLNKPPPCPYKPPKIGGAP